MRRAPKARRICRKASAFSLVELLVVVAIMGLLLSLLLPALSRAKAVAQTVVCLSQIRQINIGSHSYAAEHKGAFQGGHVHVALGPTMYYAWPGSYRAYLDDQSEEIFNCPTSLPEFWWTASYDPSSPYVRMVVAGRIDRRPTAFGYREGEVPISPREARRQPDGTSQAGFSYGYNEGFVKDHPGRPAGGDVGLGMHADDNAVMRIADVVQPSEMIAFGDTESMADYDPRLQAAALRRSPPSRRHDGRANIAFVDGHAISERVEELVVDLEHVLPGEPPYGPPQKYTTSAARARRWRADHRPVLPY